MELGRRMDKTNSRISFFILRLYSFKIIGTQYWSLPPGELSLSILYRSSSHQWSLFIFHSANRFLILFSFARAANSNKTHAELPSLATRDKRHIPRYTLRMEFRHLTLHVPWRCGAMRGHAPNLRVVRRGTSCSSPPFGWRVS